jgi:hypothetical protein
MITVYNRDPKEILAWFEANGDGQTDLSSPHLQQWIGNDWIMRKRFNWGVTSHTLEIVIGDPDLEKLFRIEFVADG